MRDEKSLNFFRKYTSTSDTKDFLNVVQGVLPTEFIYECTSVKDSSLYHKILSEFSLDKDDFGEILNFNLSYEFLLEEYKSSLLRIVTEEAGNLPQEVYTEFEGFINILSSGLAERQEFEKLRIDGSLGGNLETLALGPLDLLHKILKTNEEERKAEELLKNQEALKDAFKGKK